MGRDVEDAGLELEPAAVWGGLEKILTELTPENKRLLAIRDEMQAKIDAWHKDHPADRWDASEYKRFLTEIGYLEEGGEPFTIDTANVDPEIATIAGPQLVVPVSNARFALNAANARWGSLYDALYGTDAIPESDGRDRAGGYNPVRGASVIAFANGFLDQSVPLESGSHADVSEWLIDDSTSPATLSAMLEDGSRTRLADESQFLGHAQDGDKRTILLGKNGLHVELRLDPSHPIGKDSACGLADVVLESAITTIQDCEDSVAAVDAADKAGVYRNWLGLMRGTLDATFEKGGRQMTRRLNEDRTYTGADGDSMTLPGRSLLLVRNVGHLMRTDAVLDADGNEVFEGLLDAVMTTACALYDLKGQTSSGIHAAAASTL